MIGVILAAVRIQAIENYVLKQTVERVLSNEEVKFLLAATKNRSWVPLTQRERQNEWVIRREISDSNK